MYNYTVSSCHEVHLMQVKVLLDPTSYSAADGVSPDLIASATHRVPLSGLLKVTE